LKSNGFSLLETVVFIVLAALVIPIFYLTTQPVIKDMMTPTAWIKARFVAEKKMEGFMAYTFGDSRMAVTNVGPAAVTGDAAFPAADYAGYQWQWAITYLGCGALGGSCAGYIDSPALLTYTTDATSKYKQVEVTVQGPQGITYRAVSAVTARY
jgi:hypothetical protein